MIIGITGQLSTGKTTVARIIAKNTKAKVIDADKICHAVLKKGLPIYKKVVTCFGKGILTKRSYIDKSELSDIVFGNRKSLDKLCRIIHPEVIRIIKDSIKKFFKKGKRTVVIIDAPLLIEAGLTGICDIIVVVSAKQKAQLKRAKEEMGLTSSEAIKRIKAQMPISQKAKYADFVIHNDGTRFELNKRVRSMISSFKMNRA